jgi:hypothetical protein
MSRLPGLIHVLGFTSFAYAIYYDAFVLELPEHIHSRRYFIVLFCKCSRNCFSEITVFVVTINDDISV